MISKTSRVQDKKCLVLLPDILNIQTDELDLLFLPLTEVSKGMINKLS